MKSALRRFLHIPYREIGFARRGFRGGSPAARQHIEAIGEAFLDGYHAAIDSPSIASLVARLEATCIGYRGFRYEGAAMGVYLLDRLSPFRRDRFDAFLADRAQEHVYMAYVGAGWAHARLPFGLQCGLQRLDPLLRWLAIDGYGFHQGFFAWPQAVEGRQQVPARLRGYARHAFDQGVGRSLWFVDAHEVERIAATVARFDPRRHEDLWAGVGLAATYAGGADSHTLQRLRAHAGSHCGWLAQGSAFAAKARVRAGNADRGTDAACQVLCGTDATAAAALVDAQLVALPPERPDAPAYATWRRRIRDALSARLPPQAAAAA